VVLEDVRPERQETILALGRNLARARAADLQFEATLSLDEALDGADFVITCFRVGSREALQLDVAIPAKYGIYGDETAGPGGIFFALRTVPVVVDIAKRMESLCPDAYMINYANPTAFVADAVRRMSRIEELSLCSGFLGVAQLVEQFLGLRQEDVVAFTAGVNHYTWLLKAFVGGKDVAPDLVRAMSALDTTDAPWGWQRVIEITRAYHFVPIPGSHMVDYLFRSDTVEHQRAVQHWGLADPRTVGTAVWRHYEELAKAQDPKFDMSLPGIGHFVGSVSDLAVAMIAAIIGDRREVFAVNLPNVGQVANLPRGEIVESPAVVGAFGAQPIAVGDIPETVLPMTETLARARKLAVDAGLTGDREKLLAALMTDPLVDSLSKAKPMMEEMLAAQAQWLPQFAG
jgi:6-phospho-beta-glucosidase